MKPDVLSIYDLSEEEIKIFGQKYQLHLGVSPQERSKQIATVGRTIRAVITSGRTGLSAQEMAAMPELKVACCMGVGYEGVDVDEARRRGITVTNAPGGNADSVADHAMMLMLAMARNVVQWDSVVRDGGTRGADVLPAQLTGKRLGIVGLGTIGLRIAKRAEGFSMSIAYHNRNQRNDVSYAWKKDALQLAEASDFLVVCAPGGKDTRHLINKSVLDALGSEGYLVNVARGSLVDTEALIAALREGRIAGAGLDVVEGEPVIPPALRALKNVILTPHMGGKSLQSMQNATRIVLSNLDAFFSGQPVITPVR